MNKNTITAGTDLEQSGKLDANGRLKIQVPTKSTNGATICAIDRARVTDEQSEISGGTPLLLVR